MIIVSASYTIGKSLWPLLTCVYIFLDFDTYSWVIFYSKLFLFSSHLFFKNLVTWKLATSGRKFSASNSTAQTYLKKSFFPVGWKYSQVSEKHPLRWEECNKYFPADSRLNSLLLNNFVPFFLSFIWYGKC